MLKDIREEYKRQAEKVKELNKSYEYKVLCDSIKNPKLDIVQDYYKSEEK